LSEWASFAGVATSGVNPETVKTGNAGMMLLPSAEAPLEEPPKAIGDDGQHQNHGH
jgi:hypothetical protein